MDTRTRPVWRDIIILVEKHMSEHTFQEIFQENLICLKFGKKDMNDEKILFIIKPNFTLSVYVVVSNFEITGEVSQKTTIHCCIVWVIYSLWRICAKPNYPHLRARVNILAKIQNFFLTDILGKLDFFLDFCGVFCVSARVVRSFQRWIRWNIGRMAPNFSNFWS